MRTISSLMPICAVLLVSFAGSTFAVGLSVTSSSTHETNYVIDSTECRARSSCHAQPSDEDPDEESVKLTANDRNCRCDNRCLLYGDCCHDYHTGVANNSASVRGILIGINLLNFDFSSTVNTAEKHSKTWRAE
jgi:hypothetical protein